MFEGWILPSARLMELYESSNGTVSEKTEEEFGRTPWFGLVFFMGQTLHNNIAGFTDLAQRLENAK